MWDVTKLYEGRMRDAPPDERVGRHSIRVFMETIGTPFDEPLVDFGLFERVMDEVGLEPLPPQVADELGLPGAGSSFEDAFADLQDRYAMETAAAAVTEAGGTLHADPRISEALSMTERHKEYSFMNRWFAFRRRP